MLRDRYKIILQTSWDGARADVLLALHAKRSAASVEKFSAAHPEKGIIIVLSGTDLYRDLAAHDAQAIRTLDLAHCIVALQEDAVSLLRPAWKRKTQVIFQSARLLARARKASSSLGCVAVGHLRDEKDPLTLFAAMRLLPAALPVTVRHIGAPLDASLAKAAAALARHDPRYRYSAALPHGLARAAIKTAHLLVHPSKMEGGANVIVESVTAGTAVLASRVSGNVGMLGKNYRGYFEPGNASALAQRLVQACEDREYLRLLEQQCATRRMLFSPTAERRALLHLVTKLLR